MQDLFVIKHAYLIPLLPLVGAAIAGFFGARWLKEKSHWPIWIGVGCSALLSLWLLFAMLGMSGHGEAHVTADEPPAAGTAAQIETTQARSYQELRELGRLTAVVNYFSWIRAGDFNANWGYLFDPLTAVMLCVVCGIGFLICVFAAGYMKGEAGYFRFFAYLGLFIFMMTNLVMGENLIMLYLGWEGVGLSSYLLIGYYYEKPSAREAAKKAFLVNRIGDFGFGLGIMLCFWAFGTVSYFGSGVGGTDGLLELASGGISAEQQWALQFIPFLLMLGAFGKSAQFPLHVWLPDAMEGPTPVSALIHAATMVTAGVYMIARCSTLFVGNTAALWAVAIVGAFTAIFAGSIALRQFDLKKVFAYSTVSQLGFMFVAVGVLAPVAGVFHLVTHAFFKALLFLSSGVVMHAMAGELDMRKFSGLKRQLPMTRWLMLIGCAALAGFPLITSGYWSKDEIIVAAADQSALLHLVLLVTALLTAYYSFRVYFRVFEGPEVLPATPADAHGHGHAVASHSAIEVGRPQESGVDTHLQPDTAAHPNPPTQAHDHGHGAAGHDHGHHNHEPAIMILPLAILAVGAIFAGVLNLPWTHWLGHFLGQSPSFFYGYLKASGIPGNEANPIFFGQPGHAEVHVTPLIVGGLVALAGILLAYLLHLRDRAAADRLAAGVAPVTRLLEAKYWVDEIYQNGIVEPLRNVGRFFFGTDRFGVDGVVALLAFIPQGIGFVIKWTTQRGYLQGYAVSMLFGIAVILVVVFWR